ncbi:MAG: MBL fold metallo-hydrolase [Gammaproteobacteria bacterium]|nr:MAG: MBL fold metallo-hydrolase [Gammaproteobacteria bacterium]
MKPLLFLAVLLFTLGRAEAQEKKLEFSTTQLSGTVYMLTGRGGNVAISAGEDGVYIIDDQIRPVTTQLLQAIRKISNKPIRFVINTHYHADHTGGNETIGKAGAVIIAHDNVQKRMSTEQISIFTKTTTPPYAEVALPVVTFNDQISLHLNGETATAYYVANGHTDGDSIIHFPTSNVIHMGDMYFNTMYPYVDLDAGGSIQGIVSAADLALSLADDKTRIIPGHGPLATTEDLRNYRDFLIKAIANVQALIDEDKNLQQTIAAQPTAEWDEELGKTWITPAQFVTFIYNSLEGIQRYTPPVAKTE